MTEETPEAPTEETPIELPAPNEPQRYTLEEAAAEFTRQECERYGHSPSRKESTLSDQIGFYFCDCGQIRWDPTKQ